jgi:2-polyprenyl-3-methyl-5-hydroxy-6-metoxy-1,4-benzoquinol methylase
VGAGTGSITELYAPGRHVLAIDRSPWWIYEVDKRFAAVDNVEVLKVDLLDLVDEGQRFDSVVMLNVLEHIEDDVAVLRRAREMG